MLGLFKKKSEKEKLYNQYSKLTKQAFDLSSSNRKLSDQKTAEAEAVMKQIEALKAV
ncbi:Lacal_2735 family protein [Kordia sp.]|uniref:Lacal_2735 family protein n=1 Tax=Kordia sp. TaxID=1965332 RepID=UPI003D2AAA22